MSRFQYNIILLFSTLLQLEACHRSIYVRILLFRFISEYRKRNYSRWGSGELIRRYPCGSLPREPPTGYPNRCPSNSPMNKISMVTNNHNNTWIVASGVYAWVRLKATTEIYVEDAQTFVFCKWLPALLQNQKAQQPPHPPTRKSWYLLRRQSAVAIVRSLTQGTEYLIQSIHWLLCSPF
jgi:hypothetical protein